MQNKVVFIVGPTGVGKTDLGFGLTNYPTREIINADSIQVYKGLDIISGKDIPKDSPFVPLKFEDGNLGEFNLGYYVVNKIPIYLLDVVPPIFSFTVSHFQNLASKYVQHIINRGKLPIVIGGTGLYVKSLINGIETSNIEPDLKLRKQLGNLKVAQLQEKLKSLNEKKYSSMNVSDIQNKRRLIRAIEISKIKNEKVSIKEEKKFEDVVIGLKCDKEVLKLRIDQRVEKRLKNGAMEEVEGLFKIYDKLSLQVKDANGYKQLFSYLKNETTLEEAVYRWKVSEYRHAKNQMTWFKKYGNVKWFDITKRGYKKDIEISLKKLLT